MVTFHSKLLVYQMVNPVMLQYWGEKNVLCHPTHIASHQGSTHVCSWPISETFTILCLWWDNPINIPECVFGKVYKKLWISPQRKQLVVMGTMTNIVASNQLKWCYKHGSSHVVPLNWMVCYVEKIYHHYRYCYRCCVHHYHHCYYWSLNIKWNVWSPQT